MKLHGLVEIVLVLLLATVFIVPVMSVEIDGTNQSNTEQHISKIPILKFDNLSNNPKLSCNSNLVYNIPSSIKKFDVITFDILTIKEKLANREKIPISINGTSYVMNLSEVKMNPNGINTEIHSYWGRLENIRNSDIMLTISNTILLGEISVNNTEYYIEISDLPDEGEFDNFIHYVYSSDDLTARGPVLIDDPTIPLPIPTIINNDNNTSEDEIFFENETFENESLEKALSVDNYDWVVVRILVTTDNKWYSNGKWKVLAQDLLFKTKMQLKQTDIKVQLVPIYDAALRYKLSKDPNIASQPLSTFCSYYNKEYLKKKGADIAIYLGGYDFGTYGSDLGSSYGFDNSDLRFGLRRYAWAQMAKRPGVGYDTQNDRTLVVIHEIGHFFDAAHNDADFQDQKYNRAYEFGNPIGSQRTVMYKWWYSDNKPYYSSSSPGRQGDEDHDNARRIRETKDQVSRYSEMFN